MPKLPGIPADRPLPPVSGYVPNNSVAGAYNSVASDQMAQARLTGETFSNAAQLGTQVAQQLQEAENKRIAQEDAVARSLARTQFYTQADEMFSTAEPTLVTPGGLGEFQKGLNSLREQTVKGFAGTSAGRAALDAHLADAVSDYSRAAMSARSKQVTAQFNAELDATGNRLASKAYDAPTALDSLFAQGDAALQDAATAMTPAELAQKRAEMHGLIGYSAVDGLLNKGDTGNAQAVLDDLQARKALPPHLYSQLDRRLREEQARAANTDDWKAGPDGVLFNSRGELKVPPPEVQDYLRGLKVAGKPTSEVRVDVAGQSEFAKKRSAQFADTLETYRTQAQTATKDLQSAKSIDSMLEGIPTGNLPGDVAYQVSRFLDVNQDKVASRQAADAEMGGFLIRKAKELYPVSDADKKFLIAMSPGSAHTPESRKKLIYVMERQARYATSMAQFSEQVGAAVDDGKMTASEGRQRIAAWERHLNDKYSATFAPPTASKEKP